MNNERIKVTRRNKFIKLKSKFMTKNDNPQVTQLLKNKQNYKTKS